MNAMKFSKDSWCTICINKDLTDGQNISFRTLNYFHKLIGRKQKRLWKERKSRKERSKYKNQVTAHKSTIRDKIK